MSDVNPEIQKPDNTAEASQLQKAYRVAAVIFVASLAVAGFYSFLTWQLGAWQIGALAGIIAVFSLASFVSLRLIRKGNLEKGIWITVIGMWVVFPAAVALIADIGLIFGGTVIVLTYIVSSQSLPKKQNRNVLIGSFIVGLFTALLDQLPLNYRLIVPQIQTFVPAITAVIVLVILYFVVRQAWTGNIRTRLLASFLVLVILPLLVSSVISTLVLRRAALDDAYEHLASSASLKENSVNEWVRTMEDTLRVVYHTHEESAIADTLLREDATSGVLTEMQNDLNVIISQTDVFQELFILDLYGRVVVSTDNTDIGKLYENQEFFRKGQADLFIQPPEYSQSLGEIVVIASRPLHTGDGKVGGVLAGRANLASLNAIMLEDIGIGDTGETYLVRSNHALLTNSKFEGYPAGDTYIRTQGVDTVLERFNSGTDSYVGYRDTQVLGAYRWLPALELVLVAEVDQNEALQAASASTVTNAGVALGAALIAVVAALFVTRTIANPLDDLAKASEKIAAGELGISVPVKSNDEIGVLATAFNNMARQLSDLIATLEQRVAERTKDQAVVAEIATAIAKIQDLDEMLATTVHLTQRGFELYHAHVFVYHEETEELQIVACGYKEGDKNEGTHGTSAIPLAQEQSLVSRCARTRQPVIVNDVRSDPGWLPNPLLPDTHAEMAVPMLVGDRLLGVLDVQAEYVDAFTKENATIQSTLASQVAVAMQNIQSAETVSKRAHELETVASISTATATIQDTFEMLSTMVHLTQRGFNLYHAHVFTYNEEKEELQIVACGYKEGDENEGTHGTSVIPVDKEQSLVARAARNREPVIVNDVQKEPGWLPNPLLPDTRAELAVPMVVGGKLLGVLDVQSENLNAFTEEDANIQMTLASQVATALQNARSYESAQKQAAHETQLNTITQKIQNTTTIEEAMQIAARELGHALGKRQTFVALDPAALAGDGGKKDSDE